jgi:Protein of unknown function (DUF3551)
VLVDCIFLAIDFAFGFLQLQRSSIIVGERTMKMIHEMAMASVIVFSAFALVEMSGSEAHAGPIVPPGHYCMTFDTGGSDCSFTSYPECLATASGIDAECFGKTVRDDEDDQNQRQSRYSYARAQLR